MNKRGWQDLPAFADKSKEAKGDAHAVHVVIETPKGSRNKYKHDPEHDIFGLDKVLPVGAVFPFDFGYVPGTLGQDGDPLDVLLLMDEPAFTGCLVPARLIGVIEADQVDKGAKSPIRNDRLIAVAIGAPTYKSLREIADLDPELLSEIEHFFVSYDQMEGKQFHPLGRKDATTALRLVKEGEAKK